MTELTKPQQAAVFAAKRKQADKIRYHCDDFELIAYKLHEVAKLCEMRAESDYECTPIDSDTLDRVIEEKIEEAKKGIFAIKLRDELASEIYQTTYKETPENIRRLGFKLDL